MADTNVTLVGDHAGFELKNSLKGVLDEHAAQTVERAPETSGIALATDRYPWLRAAMCFDVTRARLAREHSDASVLSRPIGLEVARDCLLTFLNAPFAEGRHPRHVAEMSSMS